MLTLLTFAYPENQQSNIHMTYIIKSSSTKSKNGGGPKRRDGKRDGRRHGRTSVIGRAHEGLGEGCREGMGRGQEQWSNVHKWIKSEWFDGEQETD